MSKSDLLKIISEIKKAENKFFSVHFIKRTNGEARKMVARFDVKGYLRGGKPAYDFNEKNLLSVFDVQKKAYRSIPFEGIRYAKVRGKEFGYPLEV